MSYYPEDPIRSKELFNTALQHRNSGMVRRWHVTRTNRTQTVAEHTWGCCMLLMQVAPNCRAEVYKAMLMHDCAEIATGDVPATAKAMWPGLKKELQACENDWHHKHGMVWEVTEDEELLINFCDYFELMLWSYEELCMGNLYAKEPLYGIAEVLRAMRPKLYAVNQTAARLLDGATTTVMHYQGATHGFQIQPR